MLIATRGYIAKQNDIARRLSEGKNKPSYPFDMAKVHEIAREKVRRRQAQAIAQTAQDED